MCLVLKCGELFFYGDNKKIQDHYIYKLKTILMDNQNNMSEICNASLDFKIWRKQSVKFVLQQPSTVTLILSPNHSEGHM